MLGPRKITSFSLQDDLQLHVIPGFVDNYFYILEQPSTSLCAVVDPGDAQPVLNFIADKRLELTSLLLTHHHRDHVGGVPQILQKWPQATLVCSDWMKIPDSWIYQNHKILRTNAETTEFILNAPMRAIDVRGHTLDHIAFVFFDKVAPQRPVDVFVGDSLFGAGCGGLFEGTYAQLLTALANLRTLPGSTRAWCAHEYTLKNLRVAIQLGEDNHAQAQRLSTLESAIGELKIDAHELMTIPLRLAEEIDTNPFLRWDQPTLQKAIDTTGPLETLTHVRTFRDRF
jgi:hydroxyacylglutathione hydrolase